MQTCKIVDFAQGIGVKDESQPQLVAAKVQRLRSTP
jgi:hypothetical protein